MTTWWMDESAPGDTTRATIVKRPDRVLAASVFASMRLPAACEGFLEKLTPSFLSPWQARFYVLRGPHLLYFTDWSTAQAPDAAPLGAIDLRRVSSVECSSEKIILRSSRHTIRLRHTAGPSDEQAPLTLSQWASFIEDHRCQYQQASLATREHLRISTRKRTQSGARDAEVVLTDIFTETISRTSSESHRLSDRVLQQSNPLRDMPPPDQVSELEMGSVKPRVTQSSDQKIRQERSRTLGAATLPANLRRMLIYIGGIDSGWAVCGNYFSALWALRFCVMLVCLTAIFGPVSLDELIVTKLIV
jgi:hypothetical protein